MTTETATGMSRTARRQAKTRADLIKAAREIIAERGLEGLRVSDVTQRADVAFGTFYNQFKTKDDIIEAVVAQTLVGLANSIADSPAFADPAEAHAASTLAIVRIAYEDPDLARLLVNLSQAEARFERIIRPQAGALLERGVAWLLFQRVKADGARFRAFGPHDPIPRKPPLRLPTPELSAPSCARL